MKTCFRFVFTTIALLSAVSAHARFLQADPIGTKDDLNLYAYVYNDPLDKVDPSGNCIEDACIGEIAVVAGLIGGCIATHCVEKTADALVSAAKGIADAASDVAEDIKNAMSAKEHTKGKRPSTQEDHEKGKARQKRDRGGEKGDDRRDPPRKPPDGWKGPWPPPKTPEAPAKATADTPARETPKVTCTTDADGKRICT